MQYILITNVFKFKKKSETQNLHFFPLTVSWGKQPSTLVRLWYICSAVPSRKRPHPPINNVSPAKTKAIDKTEAVNKNRHRWKQQAGHQSGFDSRCMPTCEHSRRISALVLPHKVAHVTRSMAGCEEAPHVDGVKLHTWEELSDRLAWWYHKYRSHYPLCCRYTEIHSVLLPHGLISCTLSSCSLVTLSVRPPMRSSPPYTLRPGTSLTRASFPRAWSLISRGENTSYLQLIFEMFRVAVWWPHQWWCVVSTAVNETRSRFTISSSWKKWKLLENHFLSGEKKMQLS